MWLKFKITDNGSHISSYQVSVIDTPNIIELKDEGYIGFDYFLYKEGFFKIDTKKKYLFNETQLRIYNSISKKCIRELKLKKILKKIDES